LKQKTALKGLFWTLTQQIGSQFVGFVLLIILGKILSPRDYGLLGMIYIIFTIGNVLIDSGFSNSLIRNSKANDNHFSVIFNFNLYIGIFLYFLVYISSNQVAIFYNQPELSLILKVYGLSLLFNSLITTQQAYLIKNLEFKKISIISLLSAAISAVVGITLALNGFGVWSLVFTTLSSLFINLVLLLYFTKWKPVFFFFNKEIFLEHFSFGYKLMLTNLLDAVVRNSFNVLLGKFYDPKIVGYYSRSDSMKNIFVFTLITAVNKVSYPLFSKIQDNEALFNLNYKKVINILSFCSIPVLLFLTVFSKPVILLLFSEKWLNMIPYFQILCLSGILYPITSFNINSLSVKGKSNLVLKISVINKVILALLIFIVYKKGIFILISILLPFSVIEYFVALYYTQTNLKYYIKDQLKDLFVVVFVCLISILMVYFINIMLINFQLNSFIQLLILCIIFSSIYIVLSATLKVKGYVYILGLIKK
jgi:O-antigen/teichoic acid export membrane protein